MRNVFLPVSNSWIPRAVSVFTDPSLFVAVHIYVPVSPGLKSSMRSVPLLTLILPFGKANRGRVHAMVGGGKPKASHDSSVVAPS